MFFFTFRRAGEVLYNEKYFETIDEENMTVFDPLFIALFLASVATLLPHL